MVRLSPMPQDSPAPTMTMVACLRTLYRLDGRLIPRSKPDGWQIREQRPHTDASLLAWFPRWVGDRLIAEGFVDADGRITETGKLHIKGDL